MSRVGSDLERARAAYAGRSWLEAYEAFTRADEAGALYAAVAALPDDFRDVLVDVDITGLSYKETAQALKIREGTVMSRLYRARQQVVRALDT